MTSFSKLLLLLSLVFVFSAATDRHPLHVSTTEVNFNTKTKSLEVTCRIFTDDFERMLSDKYHTKADLSKESMHKAMDELIKKYMLSNLKYNLDGKAVSANYVGFEQDGEATNVYLEIANVSSIQKLSLTNSILYDLFDDQMSILHVQKNGVRKSARTNYPETNLQVSF